MAHILALELNISNFFNLTDQGLTFMPYFPDDPSCGINNIKPQHVVKAIKKFFDKPLSIVDNAPCDFYLMFRVI